eukprot:3632551-Prymnesium_polylepis.1
MARLCRRARDGPFAGERAAERPGAAAATAARHDRGAGAEPAKQARVRRSLARGHGEESPVGPAPNSATPAKTPPLPTAPRPNAAAIQ